VVRGFVSMHHHSASNYVWQGDTPPYNGLVFDEDGTPLVASHACKGKLRYRY
jgi:hypothetical protein